MSAKPMTQAEFVEVIDALRVNDAISGAMAVRMNLTLDAARERIAELEHECDSGTCPAAQHERMATVEMQKQRDESRKACEDMLPAETQRRLERERDERDEMIARLDKNTLRLCRERDEALAEVERVTSMCLAVTDQRNANLRDLRAAESEVERLRIDLATERTGRSICERENEKMRPVVEAAMEQHESHRGGFGGCSDNDAQGRCRLCRAVDAHRALDAAKIAEGE